MALEIKLLSPRAAPWWAGLLIALNTSASAHEFWVEPSAFNPASGARFDVQLCIGDGAKARPLARNDRRIERFAVIDEQGEQPVTGWNGAAPAGVARLHNPGAYILAFESKPAIETVPAQEFSSYLDEKGLEPILALREQRRETLLAARDAYSRHAKALIRVGQPGETSSQQPIDRAIGLELELIAEPVRAGEAHGFKLLYQGKPLAGALVTATRRDAAQAELHARTDPHGRAQLDLSAGMWRIAAVHMIEARDRKTADWESLWASLTFESAPAQARIACALHPVEAPLRSQTFRRTLLH